VTYLRAALSAVAALFVAILGPALVLSFTSKATGLGVFIRVFSPLCGLLAILFFALFFAASRLTSKPLRIFLFWMPVTVISTVGVGIFALFAYAWVRTPSG
jgi:hypothetical protein